MNDCFPVKGIGSATRHAVWLLIFCILNLTRANAAGTVKPIPPNNGLVSSDPQRIKFFHDWDHQGRAAALFFNGRDLGPLPRYDGNGFWLKLPVTAELTAEGQLVLDARVTKGPNVTVSRIALVPDQP